MRKYRLNLAQIKKGELDLMSLREAFLAILPIEVLLGQDQYELVYACLACMGFRSLERDNTSVEKFARKVLLAITPFKHISDPVRRFVSVILGFNGMPWQYRQVLVSEAKKDLLVLDELLAYYSAKDIVQRHMQTSAQPRNHKERTVLIFYLRTVQKREQVVEYMLYKMDREALTLAGRERFDVFHSEITGEHKWIHLKSRLPYREVMHFGKIECVIDLEKLDHRKISPFRNKFMISGLQKRMEAGATDEELNNLLLRKVPVDAFFDSIISHAKYLPLVGGRLEIFKELRDLFKKKYWHGFYALALPQIEGLFSEMLKILNPNKERGLQGALPDKVESVRPYYSSGDSFYDYYQYYLPNQRNKFAHYGQDDGIKVKAYHALCDLWFLLHTFSELDWPLMELIRMIKAGSNELRTIADIAKFATLLKDLKFRKRLEDKEAMIKDFLYETLFGAIDLQQFFSALQCDFDAALDVLDDKFALFVEVGGGNSISFKQVAKKELLKEAASVASAFSMGLLFVLEGEFQLLVSVSEAVTSLVGLFDDIPDFLDAALKGFYHRNKEAIDKLLLLKRDAKFGFPEQNVDRLFFETMTESSKWQHLKLLA